MASRTAVIRCRRHLASCHYLSSGEREDLTAFVRARIVEDDYAMIRQFRGLSSQWTYFATVVGRLFTDFRATRWPDWRPAPAAECRGPIAELLERLTLLDRLTLDDAFVKARTNHGVTLTDAELLAVWNELKMPPNSP